MHSHCSCLAPRRAPEPVKPHSFKQVARYCHYAGELGVGAPSISRIFILRDVQIPTCSSRKTETRQRSKITSRKPWRFFLLYWIGPIGAQIADVCDGRDRIAELGGTRSLACCSKKFYARPCPLGLMRALPHRAALSPSSPPRRGTKHE